MKSGRLIVSVVLIGAMFLLAGCNDETDCCSPPPADVYPFAGSPEQLMANFEAAYADLNYAGYGEVIDDSFLIFLHEATINDYSLPRVFFDYDEDMLITERMFSGQPFSLPQGGSIPGIIAIRFNLFQAEAAWSLSPADHRIPEALVAPFRVDITVDQGTHALDIKGIIEFYLRGEQVEHQGRLQTRYRMVGQVDYTAWGPTKRPTEDAAWGDLKALYR